MAKVEVTKAGWGGHKKGYQFETPQSTAEALEAHKVVKIISKDKEVEETDNLEDNKEVEEKKPKVIKSEK